MTYSPIPIFLLVIKRPCLIVVAGTEQVEKAKEMIKKMKFPFNSENFENPSLQKYWRNIEALALELDEPEEVEDFTCEPAV